LSLPVSSLYLLAAPSTPEAARDAIIERAQGGEPVSVAEVKRVIADAKGRQQPAHKAAPVAKGDLDTLDDIGPDSCGEVERLNALVEELQNQKRLAEIKNLALESELEEAKAGRAEKQLAKKLRRDERERVLGQKQCALPDRRYGVIVADPEWQWEPWSHDTGMDRSAANHYPTSILPVIAARDVPSISAKDCVLFLWATIPMLPHALVVMARVGL
jgi:hypothetical protein